MENIFTKSGLIYDEKDQYLYMTHNTNVNTIRSDGVSVSLLRNIKYCFIDIVQSVHSELIDFSIPCLEDSIASLIKTNPIETISIKWETCIEGEHYPIDDSELLTILEAVSNSSTLKEVEIHCMPSYVTTLSKIIELIAISSASINLKFYDCHRGNLYLTKEVDIDMFNNALDSAKELKEEWTRESLVLTLAEIDFNF